MAKDRFGYGTTKGTQDYETMMTNEAFTKAGDSLSPEGFDIGEWLRSKAYTEWIAEEWEESDKEQVQDIVAAIQDSFPNDPEGAQQMSQQFMNNLRINKPNNPFGRGGLQSRG